MELGVPRKYGTPFFSRYKYCFKYTAIVGIMEIAYYDKAVILDRLRKSQDCHRSILGKMLNKIL